MLPNTNIFVEVFLLSLEVIKAKTYKIDKIMSHILKYKNNKIMSHTLK